MEIKRKMGQTEIGKMYICVVWHLNGRDHGHQSSDLTRIPICIACPSPQEQEQHEYESAKLLYLWNGVFRDRVLHEK